MRRHLIIGCGPAALLASEKIRSLNQQDEIKLVTMENCLPYSPAVLPYLLSGRTTESDICIADESYFGKLRASLVTGKEVVVVLPEKKEVIYRDGGKDNYDTLLIASGSEPMEPKIKGLRETGFLPFRTLLDCRELISRIEGKRDIAIYGGGFVAMELAIALLERQLRVNLIVRSRILRLYFDQEAGLLIEDILHRAGVQVHSGREISGISREKDRVKITLSDGSLLETDVLVSCTGVTPRLSFLKGSGIRTNTGILADRHMRTNVPDVYVAGDVAEAPDFFGGQPTVSAILPNAIRQGQVAAANMAGSEIEDTGAISMNVFRFLGNMICSLGLPDTGSNQVLKERDDEEKRFKELVFDGDRLVGARFVNIDIDPGVILHLIENRVDIGNSKETLLRSTSETANWLMRESERPKPKF